MNDQSNLPVTTPPSSLSMLMDPVQFEHMQRVGNMLASSPLFPDHLRKGSPQQAAANGALVFNMAARLNEDPLTVAQNIYFVGNTPGWKTTYLIAKANQHGVFKGPIEWDVEGEGESLSVTAFAIMSGSGQRVSMTCDFDMAKAEGWTKNAKYKTMPEVMLRYRSAAFLIRMYCPEVMIAVPAGVEIELQSTEMKDITPKATRRPPKASEPEPEPEVEDVIEVEPDAKAETTDTAEKDAPSKDAEAPKPDAPERHPDREQFEYLANSIMADIEEAQRPDEVLDMYANNLEQIQANAPDLYADIMALAKSKSA